MHVDNSYNHGVGELRLSLIIPIYNGRSYIASLVREIMAQNVTGIEVIFVDDGSLDDSAAVIELEITRTDTDGGITWQLIREQNRGQGGARNAGLAAARGAWVMFCDQDDHIRDNYLRTMLETAEAAGCDILISGYDMVREDGRVIRHASLENTSWSRFMNVTPWGKVYRTSFLRKHGICFYESPYGEDVYFMLMCEAAQANVRITSYVGYAWVQHATSVSHTAHRLLDRESSALSLIHKASMEIAGLDLQDPELRYFYIKTAIYHVLCIAGTTELGGLQEYNRDMFEELERLCPGILQNSLISPFQPVGESGAVRLAVWGYIMLHRLHLDGVMLAAYRALTRR